MARGTPGITGKKFVRALKSKGCVEVRYTRNGGHLMLEAPNGQKITITAPGRSKACVTFDQVRSAAKVLDCSIEELVQS